MARPFPAKTGPFDHTPKRPPPSSEAQSPLVLPYWQTEEGIVSSQSDPSLAPDAPPMTRKTLPPRLPPSSHATPGIPSVTQPGFYVSDRSQALQEAAQQQEEEQEGQEFHQSPHKARSSTLLTSSGPLRSTGGRSGPGSQNNSPTTTARRSQAKLSLGGDGVQYEYPELGASLKAEAAATLKAGSLKGPDRDIYGQPRAVPPPLPSTYRREEAPAVINEAHLAAEGGHVLRATNTASANLIRLAGADGRQFTLSPAHIHFGNVPIGEVVHRTARLRNVSTGPARFSVSRPEPPLRVIHKPAPVPAGMEALLTIEFVAPTTPCDFVGEIVVKTEVNIITLTVSARIVGEGGGSSAGHVEDGRSPSPIVLGAPLSPVREAPSGSSSPKHGPRAASPLHASEKLLKGMLVAAQGPQLDVPVLDENKSLAEVIKEEKGAEGGDKEESEQPTTAAA